MFFFLAHASPEILETLLQWNLYSGYSLRASSAFGGNREKLTHERHVRGDAKAGGVGEKGELATITSKFSFPSRKKTGTLQSVKTVTANMLQIRKVTTACLV